MEKTEIFSILGIEITKDENLIKSAYRNKLEVTNPEDNPEGFKRLRTAYEEAVKYSKSEDEEERNEQPEDTTPSGLWVSRTKELYKNIVSRQDVSAWEALFDDDVFMSLEDEENCRIKLLAFMMGNYRFPTDVWKLFDEKLNIVSGANELREKFPADFVHYIVAKCERGEDIEFKNFEGEPEAEYDLYLQYYDRCWNALQDKDYNLAEDCIKSAEALNIFHPAMGVCKAHLLAATGHGDEAAEYIAEVGKKCRDDTMVSYNTAEILWKNNKKAEAVSIYQELKTGNDKHYMANYRLTEWYYEEKKYNEAKKCAEKVLSSGADDEFMELLKKINNELEAELERKYKTEGDVISGLELGWCYLQDGLTSKGIQIAENLYDKVPEDRDSEVKGLMTKLYMESNQIDEALKTAEMWKEALEKRLLSDEDDGEKEKDRDRIRQYHIIRMQCLRTLGEAKFNLKKNGDEEEKLHEEGMKYYNDAISESENAGCDMNSRIGVLLELARMYNGMGEYEKSLDISKKLLDEYQVYAAYATMLESYRKMWDAGGVVQAARQCINYFPQYVRAYEQAAKVFLDLKRDEDFDEIIAEAGKNEIKSVILEAYNYQRTHAVPEYEIFDKKLNKYKDDILPKISNGQSELFEHAEKTVTEYLYDYPSVYMLNERGFFYKEAHHYEEAVKDLEKALEENPAYPWAWHNLAFCYKYLGDYEKALSCFNKVVIFKEPDTSNIVYFDLGNIYSLLGDYKNALKNYKKFVYQYDGMNSLYHLSRMAECMGRNGDVIDAATVIHSWDKIEIFDRYDYMEYIYQQGNHPREAKDILDIWAERLGVVNTVWKSIMPKKKYADIDKDELSKYYMRKAWYELLFGTGERALKDFDSLVNVDKDDDGNLGDATFAAILYGDNKRGKKYADMLKVCLNNDFLKGVNNHYNSQKALARLKILARWYDYDDIKIQERFEEAKNAEICHYCNHCICKELEALEVLFMLRKGCKNEAKDRIKRCLEIFPFDEYMLSVKKKLGLKIRKVDA